MASVKEWLPKTAAKSFHVEEQRAEKN